MELKGRSFLTLKDFSPEEILGLLDLAAAAFPGSLYTHEFHVARPTDIPAVYRLSFYLRWCHALVAFHNVCGEQVT